MKAALFSCLIFISVAGGAQSYPFPQKGQLPTNPFPICGVDTFRQLSVSAGDGGTIIIPGCGPVATLNPSYYSLYCYTSGKLAILIRPVDTTHDINWELFDITGHNPNDIYTDQALAVAGNWSGTIANTGATAGGLPFTQCISPASSMAPTFSEMPSIIQGHSYLLLICDYTFNQVGYILNFTGTTAGITDATVPHLKSAYIGCDKNLITVVTNKQIRCYSLAADGSDFYIPGTNVSITSAFATNCNEQFDFDTMQIALSAPLPPGNYNLVTKNGSDGNTIWDDCANRVGQGESTPFSVTTSDSVNAGFNYTIEYGCREDRIVFKYVPANGVNQWQWWINSDPVSALQSPSVMRSDFDTLRVQHAVSNGICNDTVTQLINLDNFIKAAFQSPLSICPKDLVSVSDLSTGSINSWLWNFGDGTSSNQQTPAAHLFPDSRNEQKYHISLVVGNNRGCFDTAIATVSKLQSCYISVPNAFTPNGDGKNDYLYPLNAFLAKNFLFRVFNRFGQLVFETRDWSHKWDGSINGQPQPTDTFVWMLNYTDGLTGNEFFLHGTSVLIR